MRLQLHVPSLPLDLAGDFTGVRRLAGQVAAAAFMIAIAFVCAQIITFTPPSDAECLPEICGPAATP